MRTAIVIGAGGQDGTLLAELLHARGYRVIGLDQGSRAASPAISWESADVLQSEAVTALMKRIRPDECYYLAAFNHSAEDRGLQAGDGALFERSFSVHVHGLVNCLESIANVSPATRLFYAASSHVFGSPARQPQTESTALNPENIYGITKAAGIHCCRYFRKERGLFASVGILYNHESSLRPPNFLSQKIVRGVLACRQDPNAKLVLGDLSAKVDWGYAPDYVDAMTRMLGHTEPDDFIVATGIGHTVKDFLQAACEVVGIDWQTSVTVQASLLKKKPVVLLGDSTKLRQATGWKPSVSFRDMVRILVNRAAQEPSTSTARK
jgi:GDPmannose 4,6-dehydratase